MRELVIGEQTIRVRATPLALLYYKQEFKSDLLGDLAGMAKLLKPGAKKTPDLESLDMKHFDSVAILQLTWAMAKADAFPKKFPSFETWISTLDNFDLTDKSTMLAVMEEAADGFFRSGVKGAIKQ
ncbi:hypothetical protein [Paenibacillus ehimensis]|uniref:hypothetical protein n=1 Tax=Paenibacillus ehimensis TaxID=79264 RepID=UPI000472D8C3|nr:hypothetical protein [Paenibacillus ehimensis]